MTAPVRGGERSAARLRGLRRENVGGWIAGAPSAPCTAHSSVLWLGNAPPGSRSKTEKRRAQKQLPIPTADRSTTQGRAALPRNAAFQHNHSTTKMLLFTLTGRVKGCEMKSFLPHSPATVPSHQLHTPGNCLSEPGMAVAAWALAWDAHFR